MRTRRSALVSMTGAVALLGQARAAWAAADDTPTATLIKGTPAVLDYGSGVKVPCSRDAFYTLWEGDRFWLVFGFGISLSIETANRLAVKQATGVMKFMLLTLAFAPQRLVKGEGNAWRKKDPTAHDFVLGELDLPLRPGQSMSDAFLGNGNTQISPFWNWGGVATPFQSGPMNAPAPSPGPPTDLRRANRNAFSSQIVLKKDLSLEDVRKRAVVLQI